MSAEQANIVQVPRTFLEQAHLEKDGCRIALGTAAERNEIANLFKLRLHKGEAESIAFPSSRSSTTHALRELTAALEAAMNTRADGNRWIGDMKLVLDEVIQNAARDGNKFTVSRLFRVQYAVLLSRLSEFLALVTDEGEGFVLADVPNCTHEDFLEMGNGRGLMLMNFYLGKHKGQATYFPMPHAAERTNTVLVRAPLPKESSEDAAQRFQSWLKAGKPGIAPVSTEELSEEALSAIME